MYTETSDPDPILTPFSVHKHRPSAGVEQLAMIYEQAGVAVGSRPVVSSSRNESAEIRGQFFNDLKAIVGQPEEMIYRLRMLLEQTLTGYQDLTEQT